MTGPIATVEPRVYKVNMGISEINVENVSMSHNWVSEKDVLISKLSMV